MRESASADLREPQGSNPLGPPGPELPVGNAVAEERPSGVSDALSVRTSPYPPVPLSSPSSGS